MAPLRFITAGNYSRIVSYPAWLHCVSYRQETFRKWFPIRHGAIAFHLNRKLFANGFPSGMTLLCFIAAGNFSRMVSHPAWLHCVSSRQETIRKWFPIRHDSTVFHTDRKLFANGFLSGIAPLHFISAGNFSQMVSCPTWCRYVSSRQKTFRPEISRLRFAPLEMTERHVTIAFHCGRKLFANGFLSGMAPLCFIAAGNFSRMVSHPAWLHCVSSRQETIRKWFPIRHDSTVFHTDRKLFAYSFPFGMTPLCFISIGNYSQMVSYPAWLHCVSYRQETIRV